MYQIISESNGLYDNQEKQYNAITKIYMGKIFFIIINLLIFVLIIDSKQKIQVQM